MNLFLKSLTPQLLRQTLGSVFFLYPEMNGGLLWKEKISIEHSAQLIML
jgi:hypothetical protein